MDRDVIMLDDLTYTEGLTAKQLMEDEGFNLHMQKCAVSTPVFAKTFMPKVFFRKWENFHYELFEMLDDTSVRQKGLVSLRGFGKSSIMLAYKMRRILFREANFIVDTTSSEDLAIRLSANLKELIRGNKLLRKIFGEIKSENREQEFSKTAWQAYVGGEPGAFVMPRGAGQKVRGLQIVLDDMIVRPDIILIDDILDPQRNYTDEQRLKIKEWLMASIGGVVDRGSMKYAPSELKAWEKILVGTITHYDDALVNFMDDPHWDIKVFPLAETAYKGGVNGVGGEVYYKSLWPGYMTDKEVDNLAEEFREQGQMDAFAREYLCQPASHEASELTKEMIIYDDDPGVNKEDLEDTINLVLVDPAKTKKMSSADSAIICVGVNLEKSLLYVKDAKSGKMHPDELIAESLNMCEFYNAYALGPEVTGLDEWITQPYKDEMSRRSMSTEFHEIHARGEKEDRIKGVISYARKGMVVFRRAIATKLVLQLLTFKKSKLKDEADAFAHVLQLMDKLDFNFMEAVEGLSKDDEETIEELIKQCEEPIEGWGVYG